MKPCTESKFVELRRTQSPIDIEKVNLIIAPMSPEALDFTFEQTPEAKLFDTEIATYKAHKESLIKNALGKHALVKGEIIWGTYDNFQDAYKVGLNLFGNVPMLITEVREVEPVIVINALAAA